MCACERRAGVELRMIIRNKQELNDWYNIVNKHIICEEN